MFLAKRSLKFKLLVSVIGGIAFLASLIIGIGARSNGDLAFENASNVARSNAIESAMQIESLMGQTMNTVLNVRDFVNTMFLNDDSKTVIERSEIITILKNILQKNNVMVGNYVGLNKGELHDKDENYKGAPGHSSEGRFIPYMTKSKEGKIALETLTDFSGDWWTIPMNTLKETYTEPFVYEVQGEKVLMTSLTAPIVKDGKFVGLSGADIALNKLQEITDSLKIYNNQGKMILLSAKGMIAGYSSQQDYVGKTIEEINKEIAEEVKLFSSTKELTKRHIGKEQLSVISRINLGANNAPWFAVVQIPLSVINKDVRESVIKLIIVGLLLSLVIVGIVYVTIHKSYKKLISVETELGEAVKVTSRNSKKLQESSEKVAESATEQASSIQETVSTLDEINAMSQKSAIVAKESSEKSELNLRVANDGKRSIENMIKVIEEIRESNNAVMNQVERSNDEFQKIIGIINEISNKALVINEIVSQTKLLSFNASVEAARAGEHGKGFAVVAQEVGKLAQSSGDAATEIGSMLQESIETVQNIIGQTSSEVAKLIETGKIKIDTGVSVANECGQSLDMVLNNVNQMTSMMEEISKAQDEQATGVSNITDAMNQIDAAIHQNSNVAEQTARLSTELTQQGHNLEHSLLELKKELYGRS